MEVTINKADLGGAVKAIASKSQAHRLLICAALADSPTQVICKENSEDINATVRCLNALGAKTTTTESGFNVIPPIGRAFNKDVKLDCGESGSTLRFILPISCALGANAALFSSGRLPDRPLSPLYEELISHGIMLTEQGTVPLKCSGKLSSGKYKLSGSVSSQFISGLLFSLPITDGDSELELTGNIESVSYIDLTLSALKKFGIEIKCKGNSYFIKGNQRYNTPGIVDVEGDWSNAAFWLCAGAISNMPVTCTNLDHNSLQGDKAVLSLLESFGARINKEANSANVSRGNLRGIEIDAQNIPDLVPILAAVASVSIGTTIIRNAQRLRLKESDRLAAVQQTLTTLGADILQTEDGLIITGKDRLRGGRVSSFGDHRIPMTAAIIACRCDGPVIITGAEAVNKSYPAFFSDFASIGGQIEINERRAT